ncbi:hypothetical protein BESB_040830 [Besnoitia besnoiti]|uniref:Uncharacterized protein n=1 Tax=Besnoitia besnoiti TaxID=94643 RepID=A0A2A9MI20_BESBE|nr:hypothetical protein BESB_040830 [Besnoitia besnoiti]PFH37625.1 hypothetical protein BESB_040830 [Besnoitia besnoiti]
MAVKKNLLLNKSAVMKVVFVVSLALFFTRVVPGCEASDSDESSSSAAEEAPGAHPSGARPRSAGQPGGTGQRSTPSKIPKQPRTSSSFQQTYTLPAPLHEPGVESQRRRAGGDGSVSSGFGGMYVDPEGVDEIIQEGLLAEALRQEEEDARRGRRRSSGLGPLWLLDPGPGRGQEQPLGSQFMEGRPRIVPVSQPPRLPQQHVAAAKGLRFASDREERKQNPGQASDSGFSWEQAFGERGARAQCRVRRCG